MLPLLPYLIMGGVKAVDEAQLVERSLPVPEVRSSNPVISKLYITFLCQLHLKMKIKKRDRGRANFFKKFKQIFHLLSIF